MNVVQKLQTHSLRNKNEFNSNEECIYLEKQDIMDLIRYINDLETDKHAASCTVKKYEEDIHLLKFDFGVMESLYKNCYEEMMIQEKTINYLRQAYFDNCADKLNMELDETNLKGLLRERTKALDFCKEIFSEFEAVKNEITEFSKCSFSHLEILNDVQSITTQLNILQEVLKCDDVSKHVNMRSKIVNHNKVHLLKTIKTLRVKIKQKEDIIVAHKSKTFKLHKKLKVKEEVLKNMTKEINLYKEKNTSQEIEILSSTNSVALLENLLSECQDKYKTLALQVEPLKSTLKEKDNIFKIKQKAVQWLEFELNESSRNGLEICCESKQIFTNMKQWLYLIKREKRNLIMKIRDLQTINKLLTLQLRVPTNNVTDSASSFV